MKKIFYIAQKELLSYFRSPLAYILLVITVSIFNTFFFIIIDQGSEASLRDIFKVMEFMFVFIIPILTMKAFAEEKMSGTLEFLMTTPTTNFQIVIGKYLGTLLFFSLIVLLTGVYYLIIEIFSQPDRITTALGYLGIWIEGAFFIAIGILTSSWSRYQTLSAVCSYVIILLLYMGMFFIKYFSGTMGTIVRNIGVINHSENFYVGVLSIVDITYFLSGIAVCLLLTWASIKNRE